MKVRNILFCLIVFVSFSLQAQKLKLGELFNEGAVLQRNTKVQLWGTGMPQSKVAVDIQGKQYSTQCDAVGAWSVTLSALKEGGPYAMQVVSSNDTVKLSQVFVGEVWIAGGQSNMAFMLEKSDNGADEIAKAVNTNIRFVMVPYLAYEGDKVRGDMNWRTATTDNVSKMSAVAYYFAKDLQAKLNVPVGVICCYKGGSGAETWMTRESLLKNPELAPIVENYESYYSKLGKEKYAEQLAQYQIVLKQNQDSVKAGFKGLKSPKEPMGEQHYNRPSGLYNTMLKRTIPYTAKGVIWYQGEHNSPRAEQYRTLFPAMIEEWRSYFKSPTMPFLFVQLPGYANADSRNRPTWPELREVQLLTWKKVKNTGMAVAIELGQKDDIHPTHKEPVGKRLASNALNTVYGFNFPYSGPIYKDVKFQANQAILSFDFVYDGFKVDGELKGFTVCGENKQFVPAKAMIQNNQVIVYAEGVNKPIAVRYGWANWTDANLFNNAGFPASPFRTDDFEMVTAGVRTTKY